MGHSLTLYRCQSGQVHAASIVVQSSFVHRPSPSSVVNEGVNTAHRRRAAEPPWMPQLPTTWNVERRNDATTQHVLRLASLRLALAPNEHRTCRHRSQSRFVRLLGRGCMYAITLFESPPPICLGLAVQHERVERKRMRVCWACKHGEYGTGWWKEDGTEHGTISVNR